MVQWIEIETKADVEWLMSRVEEFHVWYVASYTYDTLAERADDDLSLTTFKDDLDGIIMTFRYGSRSKSGKWPEFQLRFGGIRAFKFYLPRFQECDPLQECVLQMTSAGWVFADDRISLTPEECEHPVDIDSCLLVVSANVKWRPLSVVTSDGPDWWNQ